MDIFVGSLPFKMKERELQEIFEKYGEVSSVKIIIDHETRQNKGFGFVKMPNELQAQHAISELNGVEIDGRPLVVNESKFKKESGRPGGDNRPERSGPRPQGSGPRSESGYSRPDSGYSNRPDSSRSDSSRPDSSRPDSNRSDNGRSDNGSFKKGNGDYQGRTFDRNSSSGSQGGGGYSSGGDFSWDAGSSKGNSRRGKDTRKDSGFDRGRGGNKGGFDRNKGKKGGNRWDWDNDDE